MSMARCHLFRPVTESSGGLLYGAEVTIRDAATSSPITQALWAGPLPTAGQIQNPFRIDNGIVDIWLDQPQRVNILIRAQGAPVTSLFLDVYPPANEVIRTSAPLTITNRPSPGKVLTGLDNSTASFQDPPSLPAPGTVAPHQHLGSGVSSTALGSGASATGEKSTAMGALSQASQDGATAFGQSSRALASGSTAVGAGAAVQGVDGTAIGRDSSANGVGGTAVGSVAAATGTRSVAVGQAATALGQSGVALGANAAANGIDSVSVGSSSSAQGARSVALGTSSSAAGQRSVAIGANATAPQDDQVVLGSSSASVVIPGGLIAQGDTVLGSTAPTSKLSFFGAPGAVRQVVTGSDGNNLVLRSLLAYLDSMGLITNSTTQGP